MKVRPFFLGLFLLTLALTPATSARSKPQPSSPAGPPANFTDSLVTAVGNPTGLAWLPDGRMLITRQAGELIVRSGATNSTLLTLGNRVCANNERGLLSVAVDPSYSSNKFIYVYYTYNKHNNCGSGDLSIVPVNRVSRFTVVDTTAPLNTELVLVDNMLSWAGNHNGGDVHFGKDGKLYISVGDGGCDYDGNQCAGSNDASRDKHMLLGKILRINSDGSVPGDNPFATSGQDCRVNGKGATAGVHCKETWAWGFRNPFRFATDPNAGDTRIYINDVGQGQREEIDLGQAGADFGWNCIEGTRTNNTGGPCSPTPPNMVAPVFEYNHANNPSPSPFQNCISITGGAFVPFGAWPTAYDNGYLFSDYGCGRIFLLKNGTATIFADNLGGSSAVNLAFGPYGSTKALYYTTYANGGEVRRIAYNTPNSPPTAAFTASPIDGPAPLLVNFDSSGSSDPNGDALTYVWTFGDGATLTTSDPTISHSYAMGTYTASLIVRDPSSAASLPVTKMIFAGNSPPVPQIDAPAAGAQFAVGQSITLLGSASDAQDGALAADKLDWEIVLHHGSHTHPFLAGNNTDTLTFNGPAPEDLAAAANSWLELRLSATDSFSQTAVVTQALQPHKVGLTFNTTPDGLTVRANGATVSDGVAIQSWEGYTLNLVAPLQKSGGSWWRFSQWGSGSTNPSRTIVTPAAATSYGATFVPALQTFLPLVAR